MSHEGRWEQRWHPLRREWVVYSAHRNQRPWDGVVTSKPQPSPSYDKDCYLCPENERIHGQINPNYDDVFVFDNDHPVVGRHAPDVVSESPVYKKLKAEGISRVICYDPRHNVTVSDLSLGSVTKIVRTWRDQQRQLALLNEIRYVLFFENKGEISGTSSLHPHCQLYATNFVFKNVLQELDVLHDEPNIFAKIVGAEREHGGRIVAENEHAMAFVPFFARYSYEVW
ncbi:MAG: galactose-1-phosphate uridylyltransferase, partial [Verrucomicrobiota bacterium]